MTKLVETIEWNDENIRNFWDFYSHYPEFYFTYQYGKQIASTLLPFMKTGSHVLDYGCGTGFLIQHLLSSSFRVYGTDTSPSSLLKVAERFSGEENFGGGFEIDKIVSDERLEGNFDVVCLIEVVEHLNDHHLAQVVRNIKKLLKKGGLLAITTPNEEDLSASYVYCPESKKVFHRWQHVRSWSTHSIATYLTKHDFTPKEVFTTDFSVTGPPPVTVKSFVRNALTLLGMLKRNTAPHPHLVYIGTNQ